MSAKKQRKIKEEEECELGSWECTVCTFRNRYEAFKCEICDTRKGTSTRKPRLNPSVVQQQTLVQNLAVQQSLGERVKKQRNSDSRSRYSPESSISMTTGLRTASCSNTTQQQPASNKIDANILKRKMIPFRDAIVVRSTAKKRVITLNNLSFIITEFKPRISPRGRKKLSTTSILPSAQ